MDLQVERICMKVSAKVGSGPLNNWLNFGGILDHHLDCFPHSSLLGDTESGINRLHCATLQSRACTSRNRHSNYDVIKSPDLGGGIHCSSASSLLNCYLSFEFSDFDFWIFLTFEYCSHIPLFHT